MRKARSLCCPGLEMVETGQQKTRGEADTRKPHGASRGAVGVVRRGPVRMDAWAWRLSKDWNSQMKAKRTGSKISEG